MDDGLGGMSFGDEVPRLARVMSAVAREVTLRMKEGGEELEPIGLDP